MGGYEEDTKDFAWESGYVVFWESGMDTLYLFKLAKADLDRVLMRVRRLVPDYSEPRLHLATLMLIPKDLPHGVVAQISSFLSS